MATGTPVQADAILTFWFQDCRPIQWFRGGAGMDHEIRDRFGGTVQQAIDGDCQHWHRHQQTALALVLLLDQFPRHIWRGKAAAYAGDQQALELSLLAEQKGWLQHETQRARRQFWLMHSNHASTASHGLSDPEPCRCSLTITTQRPNAVVIPPMTGEHPPVTSLEKGKVGDQRSPS